MADFNLRRATVNFLHAGLQASVQLIQQVTTNVSTNLKPEDVVSDEEDDNGEVEDAIEDSSSQRRMSSHRTIETTNNTIDKLSRPSHSTKASSMVSSSNTMCNSKDQCNREFIYQGGRGIYVFPLTLTNDTKNNTQDPLSMIQDEDIKRCTVTDDDHNPIESTNRQRSLESFHSTNNHLNRMSTVLTQFNPLPGFTLLDHNLKMIHFHLLRGKLIIYDLQELRKLYSIHVHDIQRIEKSKENIVTIDMLTSLNVQGRQRKYMMYNDEIADKLVNYVEYYADFGRLLRHWFTIIDWDKKGMMNKQDLMRILHRYDLAIDDQLIDWMMEIGKRGYEVLDFCGWFELLYPIFVCSLYDCLQLWIVMAYHSLPKGSIASNQQIELGNNSINDHEKVVVSDANEDDGVMVAIESIEISREGQGIAVGEQSTSSSKDQELRPPTLKDRSNSTYPTATSVLTDLLLAHDTLELLPGELIAYVTNESWIYWGIMGGYTASQVNSSSSNNTSTSRPSRLYVGQLIVTNYRMIVTSIKHARQALRYPCRYEASSSSYFDTLFIPLATITKISPPCFPRQSIYISCKDYRTIRLTFIGRDAQRTQLNIFVSFLQNMSFCTPNTKPQLHLFAYLYQPTVQANMWCLSDIQREYQRQGLHQSSEWQMYDNSDYNLCSTYPKYLILPKALSEAQIRSSAAFRSQQRLPVVTYRYAPNGAVLARSSQPLVGIIQKTCQEDERLLNLIRTKGKNCPRSSYAHEEDKLFVLDARGKLAATLNMATGKGTEDVSVLPNTELIFGNIDNIHIMRSSAQQLTDAIYSTLYPNSSYYHHTSSTSSINTNSFSSSSTSNHLVSCLINTIHSSSPYHDMLLSPDQCHHYMMKLEECGWYKHIRLLLLTSLFTVEKLILESSSVLIHCSDGWDRTSQICSICQILMEPYYRTLQGFAVLIEKEWCSFGHKFQDRCGQGQASNHHSEERSPIFIQFLDTIYQLLCQYPNAFEFNCYLLVFVADHHYSCLFGNFLGNCDRDRHHVHDCTVSIWTYIYSKYDYYRNKDYQYEEKVLWPEVNLCQMKVWMRYWGRWEEKHHPGYGSQEKSWEDDWGENLSSSV